MGIYNNVIFYFFEMCNSANLLLNFKRHILQVKIQL